MAEIMNSMAAIKQHFFAAQGVAEHAGPGGPEDAAHQVARSHPALQDRIQLEMLLHEADGAGDDGRVVAEQQAPQRRHRRKQGDVGDAALAVVGRSGHSATGVM